jgi:hypothetical protein
MSRVGPILKEIMGDLVYVLFLAVVIWLAVQADGGGGGGRRARVPAL